ncbi:hypothetical protein GJW-30_1_03296 [Variibacter gotjawalensis]|uniref:Uncharacterized protein n=1 Tax=Variibacter gotjawalensis TaxID=1333996 RepID=A0A0S3PXT7_9BRAD|nr:hypothetical protein [Variibacter gotjawalensis]NIK46580.1 hypothetical protein [Variibacter gotjawalensis]RZS48484.1 hypothetical protein EV661_0899 [Variibacter gotjawalensis]BAT60746.1 hypothetical protein GJW-30_1_03296 [Variibacter gotjawalensis]
MALISKEGLLRSTEGLAGSQSLFSQPGGIAADQIVQQLAALTPLSLTSIIDGSETSTNGAAAVTSSLENPGDLIVQLGQNIADVGHDNGRTLVADAVLLPGEATGLNNVSGNAADALTNIGQTVQHVGTFVNDITDTLGNAGNVTATDTANAAVLDFHQLLETTVHETGANFTVHGVTETGETVGLGFVGNGNDNLVTDVLDLPMTALSGGNVLGEVDHIVGHVPGILDAATNIVTQIPTDLGSGPLGLNITGEGGGILGGSGLDIGNLSHILGQDGSGPLSGAAGLVDNVTNVLTQIGSNSDGSGNLVTDVLNLPGEILSGGPTPSLTDAGAQLNTTLNATGNLVESVLSGTSMNGSPNGILGNINTALDNFGNEAGPAIGIPQTLTGVNVIVDGLGQTGTGNPHGVLDGVTQTVNGALNDVHNDVALSNLGLGDGALPIPALGNGLADTLVGSLTGTTNTSGLPVDLPAVSTVTDLGIDHGLLPGVTSVVDLDHVGKPGLGLGLI